MARFCLGLEHWLPFHCWLRDCRLGMKTTLKRMRLRQDWRASSGCCKRRTGVPRPDSVNARRCDPPFSLASILAAMLLQMNML